MATPIEIRASRAPAVAVDEYRFNGAKSGERAVGHNGEINASDRGELLRKQFQFMQASAQGNVVANSMAADREQFVKRNADLITAAFNNGEAHRVLGQKMADSLFITANRQGFTRKLLLKTTVAQGSIPRFAMRSKDVMAAWSTSATKVETQITRDRWLTPPELQIVARPFVTQTELNQSASDVLEEKYVEATEAIMVSEDRLAIMQANELVGVDNNLLIAGTTVTPEYFAQLQNNVIRWGLKASTMLIASDIMIDVIGDRDFIAAIDPVARHELLLTGELGTIYGSRIITDAYRHQAHKVLNRGELYCFADPINLGAYSDRDGITSTPITISTELLPGRGWVLNEAFALTIANSRAVAKGIRA